MEKLRKIAVVVPKPGPRLTVVVVVVVVLLGERSWVERKGAPVAELVSSVVAAVAHIKASQSANGAEDHDCVAC